MKTKPVLTGPLLALSVLLFPAVGNAFCFNAAGEKYKIDPLLLKAIAVQESGLNPNAIHHNRNRSGKVISTDYGLTQINSAHLPSLIKAGIIRSQDDLLSNPCLNVQIGAWILARHIKQCGVNWLCLGTYNAGFRDGNDEQRMKYARRIYAIYTARLAAEKIAL